MNKKNILIKKYFESHSFVESNINSFNNFIDVEMQNIVNEMGEIIPTVIPADVKEFKIKFNKIWITKPQLVEADGSKRNVYPIESRLRKLTYSAPMYLEVSAYIDGIQRETFTTEIGKMPIMLKSKYCHLSNAKQEELIKNLEDPDDIGGYFILNGNERVLIIVEDLASNKVFIQPNKSGPSKHNAKIFSEKGAYRIPHTIEQMKDGIIYITFTKFRRVPLIAVIKALGLVKDHEISSFIADKQEVFDDMFINLYNCMEVKTEANALEFLAKKAGIMQIKDENFEKIKESLDKYLLPHLGITPKDRIYKAYTLCKLMKKFFIASKEGTITASDKDHYMNKRLRLSGDLMSDLFRVNLRILINDILYNFQRLIKRGKFSSLKIIIRDKLLTSRIQSSMSTGNWVGNRKGVSQNIDRINFLASLSHLQRVVSLLSSTQENFEARALHPTNWGRLCLGKDTNVLLADNYSQRTLESLQNCWNHHSVTTFNTETNKLIPSAIKHYYTSNPKLLGKKVYKLTSESGRHIIATEDHPFFTTDGWIDAENINHGSKVAVYPAIDSVEQPIIPTKDLGKTIVIEEDIIKKYGNKKFKHSKYYIQELHERELLPFTTNNYKIEIIARLLGHLYSDGHIGLYNLEFTCGTREDAESVARDIRLLGFEPSRIVEQNTKIQTERGLIKYKTFKVTKGSSLRVLLTLAGAPVGKKTDIEYKLPKWIFDSSKAVQREFLAGFLGGDGPKLRSVIRTDRKSGSKPHIDNIIFHKKASLIKNAEEFGNDIKKLFERLNIKIIGIALKHAYVRKDQSPMLKGSIIFGKSQDNLKKIATVIGYRYCKKKELESGYMGEWLRLRESAITKQMQLKRAVKSLYAKGKKPKEISRKLKIDYRNVQQWLYEPKKFMNTRLNQKLLPSFEQWLKMSKLGENGAIWEKIISKEIQDVNDVRDFTTAENTHTLIANGFITHNCAIETPEGTSIGLRKNLAILAEITQEEVPEDKIKKVLEASGLVLK